MKQKKYELNVDFIGGAEPLTKEEEKKISAFIKASKESKKEQSSIKKQLQKTEV